MRYFIGNWKMFGIPKSINILNKVNSFISKDKNKSKYRVIITTPYTLLESFAKYSRNKKIIIGSQNCYQKDRFSSNTSAVSSYMLKTAKGDKESFRFIANALGYKMHSTAIKILGKAHLDDVDDVVQISLIKVWQLAPRWVNTGSVEGYIYKIVFSTCMDFLRTYKSAKEFKDTYYNLKSFRLIL